MAGVRLLVLAATVAAIAASANAAQVRKLRGWQVTHITMATTMSDQLTNPQLEVCDNGEERVLAVTTVNKIDAHPTRMHWWAIYFPSVHRVLPYGVGQEGKSSYERSTFVIDADGNVAKIMRRVNPDRHADEVLAALS